MHWVVCRSLSSARRGVCYLVYLEYARRAHGWVVDHSKAVKFESLEDACALALEIGARVELVP